MAQAREHSALSTEVAMGFLQKFGEWWKSTEPINREELAEDFETYPNQKRIEVRENLKLMKTRLEQIVRIAFAHIEAEALDLLVKRVHKELRSEGELSSESEALRDGLIADFFKGRRIPYAFSSEAGYFENEDVGCLNKLLRVNGVERVFEYVSPNGLNVPMDLLESFTHFLELIELKCVALDTGGDEYVVFITQSSSYQQLVEAASRSGISLTDKPHLM